MDCLVSNQIYVLVKNYYSWKFMKRMYLKAYRFFVSPDRRHVLIFAPKRAWLGFCPEFYHASSMSHKDYLMMVQLGYLGLTMWISEKIQILLQKIRILSLNQSILSLLKHFCHIFDYFQIHCGFFVKKALIMYSISTLLKMLNLYLKLEFYGSLEVHINFLWLSFSF